MSEITVLIVGCGNIAGQFDMNGVDTLCPVTHMGAYALYEEYRVLACIDTDLKKSQEFAHYWGIPNAFSEFKEVFSSGLSFDVISICTPTFNHSEAMNQALKMEPKLIFCEKPLAQNYQTSARLSKVAQEKGIPIMLNYTRQWDSDLAGIIKDIETNKYGGLVSILGKYSKGILNNGSHFFDIIHRIFSDIEINSCEELLGDSESEDPSLMVRLTAGQTPITLFPYDSNNFAIFEIEFVFKQCVITMEDGGRNWTRRLIAEDSRFSGYSSLSARENWTGGYKDAMATCMKSIVNCFNNEEKLVSLLPEALAGQSISQAVLDMHLLKRVKI